MKNDSNNLSLAGVLDGIEPSLPESLFGAECRRQMRRVAERLPMRLSSFWGFECRLGEPEPLSDILFQIANTSPGPGLLAGGSASSLDGLCEAYPAWRKFRSFARDWANPEHPWNLGIRNVWLEMDLAGADAEEVLRQPNIFFGPKTKTPKEKILPLIEELLLLFERPAAGAAGALREFLGALPEGAEVFQIGLMLARPDDAGIRLCVNEMAPEPEKILPWLGRLWPAMGADEAESLRGAFETFSALCDDLAFGFNLTENGTEPALGVECYRDWLENGSEQWDSLLDEAERRALSLPEKARGVKDYAGITPSPLRERIAGDVVYIHTYRKIHHLKFTLSRGKWTQAKAYLAVSRPGLPLSTFGLLNTIFEADKRAGEAWNTQ